MNRVLNYPGSKWSIAGRIVALAPPHHGYVEPYFGSGAVLSNKPPSAIETVNDLDGVVFGGHGGGGMKQYCRHCCYLRAGNGAWCTKQERRVSAGAAGSPNRCHDYAPDPTRFTGNGKGRIPGAPKKKQCDGQMSLGDPGVAP